MQRLGRSSLQCYDQKHQRRTLNVLGIHYYPPIGPNFDAHAVRQLSQPPYSITLLDIAPKGGRAS